MNKNKEKTKNNFKERMLKMKIIDKIALILIIIGAINWGLIGLFRFNLVELIFGDMTVLARIVYSLVGIAGLWGIKLAIEDK